jgi:hypothetical protein
MPLQPDNPKELGYYLALGQAGLEMVVPVAIGVAVEHYFPAVAPWAVVVGAILGPIVGLTHLVMMTNKGKGPDDTPSKRTGDQQ